MPYSLTNRVMGVSAQFLCTEFASKDSDAGHARVRGSLQVVGGVACGQNGRDIRDADAFHCSVDHVRCGAAAGNLIGGHDGVQQFTVADPPAQRGQQRLCDILGKTGGQCHFDASGLQRPQGILHALKGHRCIRCIQGCQNFLEADIRVGLGPFAGVLALICHNTGVMGKLWAEAMEESDQGPVQALASAGATKLQQTFHASIPLVVPQFVGLLLYRFDVNVRSSLVLGLVGAGGVGLLINQAIKSLQFDQMLTHMIVVLILIVVVDQASALIRRRLSA